MRAAYKIVLMGTVVSLLEQTLHALICRIHPLPLFWTWFPPVALYLTAGYFIAVLLPRSRWWSPIFLGGVIGIVDQTIGVRLCYLISGSKPPSGPNAAPWIFIVIVVFIVAGFFSSLGFATRKLSARFDF